MLGRIIACSLVALRLALVLLGVQLLHCSCAVGQAALTLLLCCWAGSSYVASRLSASSSRAARKPLIGCSQVVRPLKLL